MQYLLLGLVLIGFIGGLWAMSRAMTAGGRNEGSRHGGGLDGETPGARDYHHDGGGAGGDGD